MTRLTLAMLGALGMALGAAPINAVAQETAPVVEVAAAPGPQQLIREICFRSLGDLGASATALSEAGFTEVSAEGDVSVYEKAGSAAVLSQAVLAGETRPTTQCTLVLEGLSAEEAEALVLVVLRAEKLEIKQLRRLDGAVIRDFGSQGAGRTAPALGSIITLGKELSAQMKPAQGAGVSILTRPGL